MLYLAGRRNCAFYVQPLPCGTPFVQTSARPLLAFWKALEMWLGLALVDALHGVRCRRMGLTLKEGFMLSSLLAEAPTDSQ